MAYMIFLAKEKDIGKGCADCHFRFGSECLADKRVDVFKFEGDSYEINKYRPYKCPFRYFDTECRQICKRLNGKTEEETKGWFDGADSVYKHYVRLEEERDRYIKGGDEN